MQTVINAIANGQDPGIYQTPFNSSPALAIRDIHIQLQEQGFRVFYLDGQAVANKPDFLKAIAAALHLPDYFGMNWDALSDCLTDVAWNGGDRAVVIYAHPNAFAQTEPEEWGIALEIFQEAIETWWNAETPMYVVLQTDEPLEGIVAIA